MLRNKTHEDILVKIILNCGLTTYSLWQYRSRCAGGTDNIGAITALGVKGLMVMSVSNLVRQTAVFDHAVYPGLSGKVVLVTGGGNGIGRAMAEGNARHGARLVLIDIDREAMERTASELQEKYQDVEIEIANISTTDEVAVERACAQAEHRFGRIDVMLSNAGIAMNKPSLELTADEWRRTIDINLNGVFICAQAAGRRMVRQKSGSIVSTASIWGISASKERAAYCASKAAIVSLTKALAVEWAPYGVRVNAIAPGYTSTRLMEDLSRHGRIDADKLRQNTPLGRFGTPEEMAEAALYLASDAAAFITGHTLVSDGGWIAASL
jgi:NAD(P)-dependent dehydrogenase (short-subunit alcohol dehydrogenase family)